MLSRRVHRKKGRCRRQKGGFSHVFVFPMSTHGNVEDHSVALRLGGEVSEEAGSEKQSDVGMLPEPNCGTLCNIHRFMK